MKTIPKQTNPNATTAVAVILPVIRTTIAAIAIIAHKMKYSFVNIG